MGRPRDLRRRYGLSVEDHDRILRSQDNRCAICGKPSVLVVDHDHSDNSVRGLLCNQCNLMLGHAGDNVETLIAGADYLDSHLRRVGSAQDPAIPNEEHTDLSLRTGGT